MDSLGRVQGIQDPELRDKLQDPVKRSGIYTKDDYEMLKNGQYEEYHQKSIENMCKMGQTVADAIIGMLVPKIDGSTEYQQTKIQESQMAINKLIVTVGDQEDRLTQVEQNIITKDEMITWTTSMQNPQEGGGANLMFNQVMLCIFQDYLEYVFKLHITVCRHSANYCEVLIQRQKLSNGT